MAKYITTKAQLVISINQINYADPNRVREKAGGKASLKKVYIIVQKNKKSTTLPESRMSTKLCLFRVRTKIHSPEKK